MAERIMITGGAGFIGLTVSTAFTRQGHEVLVYDKFEKRNPSELLASQPGNLEIVQGDILDIQGLDHTVRAFRPDRLIHLAAIHFIPQCDASPSQTMQINVVGTQNVISVLKGMSDCELIFASSAAVYSPDSPDKLTETSPLAPNTLYGLSKLFGEQLVRHGVLNYKIIRLFNVYGAGDSYPHLIPHIIRQYQTGRAVELGNPDSRRDFVYIDDAAAAVISVVEHGVNRETYNAGTGESYSARDIAERLKPYLPSAEFRFLDQNRRPHDAAVLCANNTKLVSGTGWRPKVSLDEGLKLICKQMLSNQTGKA